jgi:hypothetical protein
MFCQTLDAPPSEEQLKSWGHTRIRGRQIFIWRAVLLFCLQAWPIWFALKIVLSYVLDKELEFGEGIAFVPAMAVIAWMNARLQWHTNEKLYWAAINKNAIAPGQPPYRPVS